MKSQETIDLDALHAKVEHLRVHAEDLYDATTWFDDSDFRRLLYTSEQGADYTSQLYSKLIETIDDFWKFRLALVWDALPKQRTYALRFCQKHIVAASRSLAENAGQTSLSDVLPLLFDRLSKASVLLQREEQVTTETFAEGAYALAHLHNWGAPGRSEWENVTTFLQDLYGVFNPKQKTWEHPLPASEHQH
jgi:hypothetical protein